MSWRELPLQTSKAVRNRPDLRQLCYLWYKCAKWKRIEADREPGVLIIGLKLTKNASSLKSQVKMEQRIIKTGKSEHKTLYWSSPPDKSDQAEWWNSEQITPANQRRRVVWIIQRPICCPIPPALIHVYQSTWIFLWSDDWKKKNKKRCSSSQFGLNIWCMMSSAKRRWGSDEMMMRDQRWLDSPRQT